MKKAVKIPLLLVFLLTLKASGEEHVALICPSKYFITGKSSYDESSINIKGSNPKTLKLMKTRCSIPKVQFYAKL
jgi:hypothetical protein